MSRRKSSNAALVVQIMLAVFRVNGRLLARGDELVAPLDLTSARWQVLGAVAMADTPLTAPQIADAMGITRQGAQKQLNRMVGEGLFRQLPNPRHERSPLYALSDEGQRAYDQAIALNDDWAAQLARAFQRAELETTLSALMRLHQELDAPVPAQKESS